MVERLSAAIKADGDPSFVAGWPGRLDRPSLLLSLQNVYETLAVSAPTVVDAFRGTVSFSACNDRLERWSSHVVRNAEIVLTVRGRENLTGHACVVMSNHQSHYDVPVLFTVLGANIRMVAKKELFGLPVFGQAMRSAGFIEIDRENRAAAIASLAEAKRHLAEGTHIWIAPEGTRSVTGELLPFKKGGFVLAIDTGAPILPITIRGTRDVLRAKGLLSRKGAEVTVTLHPPIETARVADAPDPKLARENLVAEVRRSIASAL
jgi:1-acyl-sn-glycerol-3-phosphate acyltransferase